MNRHYQLIADALLWLSEEQPNQPGLAELAARFNMSEAHLQRTFQDHAGVSPKQFLKHLTREQALARLRNGETVLDAALESGLSGPGRLHDLMVSTTALSPGEARQKGKGVAMKHGLGMTPFGPALLAWTARGITFLGFCNEKSSQAAFAELRAQWPGATLEEDPDGAATRLAVMFDGTSDAPLKVWLRGSPFQLKIWEALLAIPAGAHWTYGQMARFIDQPGASRAVGSAIGRNPVAWLIPCHRVITRLGETGGYRWGTSTKRAMIGMEAASVSNQAEAA